MLEDKEKAFQVSKVNAVGHEQMMKGEGGHADGQEVVPYLLLDQHTPRHGDFPFQIVHLYHVPLDIYSESTLAQEIFGIPWATFAIDAHSWRQLAVYLAFDLPRHSSYFMVLRECVRRYRRLPQILVIDEGSGLNSDRFKAFLATCRITKVERPLAKPDAALAIEQLFGMSDIDFIEDVLDHTQNDEKLRAMTRTVDPDPRARWPLEVFYQRLCEWCYEVYDNRPHPALGQTPREAYEAGMLLSDVRSSYMIPYDETFRMLTLPMRRNAKVFRGRGVKVNHLFYWSDVFRSPEVENAAVPIGYDPADLSHVYAFVKGRWVKCL